MLFEDYFVNRCTIFHCTKYLSCSLCTQFVDQLYTLSIPCRQNVQYAAISRYLALQFQITLGCNYFRICSSKKKKKPPTFIFYKYTVVPISVCTYIRIAVTLPKEFFIRKFVSIVRSNRTFAPLPPNILNYRSLCQVPTWSSAFRVIHEVCRRPEPQNWWLWLFQQLLCLHIENEFFYPHYPVVGGVSSSVNLIIFLEYCCLVPPMTFIAHFISFEWWSLSSGFLLVVLFLLFERPYKCSVEKNGVLVWYEQIFSVNGYFSMWYKNDAQITDLHSYIRT